MDAVLLAHFAKHAVSEETRLCDLCTGTGIVALLLAAKTACQDITALELQAQVADMAARSVKLNGQEHRVHVIQGDVRDVKALGLSSSFQVVTANPPYMDQGLRNTNSAKLLSRHEIACSFQDVAAAAAQILRSNGRFFLVHRPNRLVDVMGALRRAGLEPKRLRFVHTYADREANLFLLEAVKGAGKQLKVEAPLVVYQKQGVYTEEVAQIYSADS